MNDNWPDAVPKKSLNSLNPSGFIVDNTFQVSAIYFTKQIARSIITIASVSYTHLRAHET